MYFKICMKSDSLVFSFFAHMSFLKPDNCSVKITVALEFSIDMDN